MSIDGNHNVLSSLGNRTIKKQYHRPETLIKWKYICPVCGNYKLIKEVEEVLDSQFSITPDGEEGKCIKVEKSACDCNCILLCRKCGAWVNFNDIYEFDYWENEWYGKTVDDVKEWNTKTKEFEKEIQELWLKHI